MSKEAHSAPHRKGQRTLRERVTVVLLWCNGAAAAAERRVRPCSGPWAPSKTPSTHRTATARLCAKAAVQMQALEGTGGPCKCETSSWLLAVTGFSALAAATPLDACAALGGVWTPKHFEDGSASLLSPLTQSLSSWTAARVEGRWF